MAKKKTVKKKKAVVKKKPDQTLAIVGLILNIVIMPGIGSIVGGRVKEGIWQLVLFIGSIIVGLLLIITIIGMIIGIPILIFGMMGAWIWALVTGIQMVQEAS